MTLRLEGGREERGAALIAADGIRSAIRAQLRGDEPRYAGYSGWRGLATMDKPPLEPGFGKQVGGRGRTWGAFALRGNRVYWFSSAKMEEGLGDSPAGRKNDVRETFAGAPDWVLEVIEATPEEEILRHDIFDRPPVDSWGDRRVTMIGDAAHATTPNTGQGGSHALLDGVIVGEGLTAVADSLGDAGGGARRLRELRAAAAPADLEGREGSRHGRHDGALQEPAPLPASATRSSTG